MGCAASKEDSVKHAVHKDLPDQEPTPDVERHVRHVPTDDAGSSLPDAVSIHSQLGDQSGHQKDPVIRDESQPATSTDALRNNFLEVRTVLQQLTAVNQNPVLGLAEAAELLHRHLNVSLVSIIACTEGLASYVLVAACGTGSTDLESCSFMQGADWSPFMLDSNTNHIYVSVDGAEQLRTLPKDWEQLYQQHGLKSFMLVPVAVAGKVLGLLTIAKADLHGFDDEWWEPMLSVLAVGLLPQLRSELITGVSHLVRVLHGTQDHFALIAQLLQGAQECMLKATNIEMAARLGLVKQDLSMAYIFEIDNKTPQDAAKSPDGKRMPDVTITSIGLENTLLADAIKKCKARFVSDCANYLQSCVKPATDIFISSQQMAASIVVLPLQYGKQTLGGLYFTLENPSNFQNLKDTLMGFVNSIVLVMVQKLEGKLHQFWDLIVQRQLSMGSNSRRNSMDAWSQASQQQQQDTSLLLDSLGQQQPYTGAAAGAAANIKASAYQPNGSPAGALGPTGAALDAAGMLGVDAVGQQLAAAAAAGGGNGSIGGGSVGPGMADDDGSNAVEKKPIGKRTSTHAMLMVLQNEIRKTHERKQQLVWLDDLVLLNTIGKGAFGVVYQGSWKGSLAAIKVMYARQHERQAMKDALEMAVLTSVSHPNIIQVYNCFTNMLEEAGSLSQQPEGRYNTRFRRLEAGEDTSQATCNIMVMEYCDRGSLWHAMKQGLFHKRLSKTSVAVDLSAIVQVLIEVAASVHYLHNMQLLHCDIKPDNVLLKSDSSSPTGFITKLSDFGLAKLLRDKYYIINRSGSGTITHLAPELFKTGSKVTAAVDAFSFGIMMWEMYMGQRAYSGLPRDAIIDKVYKHKGRPVFPAGVPALYSELACNCWESDQHLRPSFTTIRQKLQDMLCSFRSGAGVSAGAAHDAVKGPAATETAAQQQQQLQELGMQLAAQQQAVQQHQQQQQG